MQAFLDNLNLPEVPGRASATNPSNRFEKIDVRPDPEWLAEQGATAIATEYFFDATRDILAKNKSPDIPFTFSINPYRGCEHGCIYCYARPTHEYFGLSAGLDFETKILVKRNAATLLRKRLASPRWTPQVVAFSGNTDCYQPAERDLEITRDCLKVFSDFRNPVSLITKSALVTRDLDVLQELAAFGLVSVTVSVTTLDNQLARVMEPRASAPAKRLEALAQLTAAGIPVCVNVAPVIPGLTDHEVPLILKEAAACGVQRAAYILLRLPHGVKELTAAWLKSNYPNRMAKVLSAVRQTRSGRLNDPAFGTRGKGSGARADAIQQMFTLACEKYGLSSEQVNLNVHHFRKPGYRQLGLFF